jgi:hypothetical protein
LISRHKLLSTTFIRKNSAGIAGFYYVLRRECAIPSGIMRGSRRSAAIIPDLPDPLRIVRKEALYANKNNELIKVLSVNYRYIDTPG